MLHAVWHCQSFHACVFGMVLAGALATSPVIADEDPPHWVTRWGEEGTSPGQFGRPRGMTLDGTNRLLICDTDNNRIQVFDTSGNLLDIWGETGSEAGQFLGPIGIDVAPNDEVYVVDTGNNRVQRFQPDGTWLGEWDGTGLGEGGSGDPEPETWSPFALTVDRHHNVYVTDTAMWGSDKIHKFDSAGVFERSWNLEERSTALDLPLGIASSPDDYIYVSRTGGNVYQFRLDGSLVRTCGGFSTTPIPGTFKTPLGVDVDSLGNVFVVDHHNRRMQKFNGAGEFLSMWGTRGDQPDQFGDPHDITVGAGNNIFIVDLERHGYIKQWTYDTTSVEATSMSRFKSLLRGDPGR